MGHTCPSAAAPFGLAQSSPQTDLVPYRFGEGYNREAYRYCAGYQYGDSPIVGFVHTHFGGTGHADLGDLLPMPTVDPRQLDPGPARNPEQGYRSRPEIDVGDGRTFTIVAENRAPVHVYVLEATLNGKTLDRNVITHEELVAAQLR